MPRILVVGSANVDFTVALARLPTPGETVSNGSLLVDHGGKGANQAVAARRLGADVRFVGCVGDDDSGRAIRAALAAQGIGVDGVAMTTAAATGTALITVDVEGRNQIAVAPGANRTLAAEHVGARDQDFAWAEVVLCQFENPLVAVRAALEAARRHGAITVLNPAPAPDAPIDVWPLVDWLTPNEGEAERLSGVADPTAAAAALRQRGVGIVVVTRGGDDVFVAGPTGTLTVAAFEVTVVDTTAAGDTFNAALAVSLAQKRSLEETLRFANAAAGLTCTRRGAQASLPTRAEVDALIRRNDTSR